MEIKDDGVGFDIFHPDKQGGIGLGNMKERAKLLKGEITIESEPGAGCVLSLWINNVYS
jgi:signal transduction histidine kinase